MHPTPPGDSWRSWLATGNRGAGADRRRVSGAHRGLKKLLIEGMSNGGEHLRPWKDFSGAMVRQAVNEALNRLPADQRQAVQLAYFGGLSNREIAQHLGLSVGGVQRRLRQALARVSEHVEHGRAMGHRVLVVLFGWLAIRRLGAAFKVATVTVAVSVIAVQPAPAVQSLRATSTPPAATSADRRPAPASPAGTPSPLDVNVPDVVKAVPALPVELPPVPTPPPLPTPLPKLP
jgi:RNA polymerase sigma factor (sigma-70 family)